MHVDDGEPEYYYPRIDVTVNAGDGIIKSKSFSPSIGAVVSSTAYPG